MFAVNVPTHKELFHSVEYNGRSVYLLPTRNLLPDFKFEVAEFNYNTEGKCYFSIFSLFNHREAEDSVPAGFLFESKLPVRNLTTSILAYSASWQRSVRKPSIDTGEISLLIKNPNFYVYHAPSKATMVTCSSLDPKFVDFLTCI